MTNGLRALKLGFSQGFESPWMECRDTFGCKLENRTINTSKKISKICLFVDTSRGLVETAQNVWGIKFLDGWGDVLFCQQWSNRGFQWVEQRVPDGYEVIGFFGNTQEEALRKFSFILWKPNVLAQ